MQFGEVRLACASRGHAARDVDRSSIGAGRDRRPRDRDVAVGRRGDQQGRVMHLVAVRSILDRWQSAMPHLRRGTGRMSFELDNDGSTTGSTLVLPLQQQGHPGKGRGGRSAGTARVARPVSIQVPEAESWDARRAGRCSSLQGSLGRLGTDSSRWDPEDGDRGRPGIPSARARCRFPAAR